MASIKPFKGIRYNRSLVSNPADLITPPYDVISPFEQEQLHAKSPYNIIRLEFGKVEAGDNDTENRYSRAANIINLWLQEKVLQVEGTHSYYLYEQCFTYNSSQFRRRGLFAALKLEPYSSRVILPHEITMAGPKKDRLELLSHSRTNISPIFTLFPDPEGEMEIYFESVINGDPLIDTTDDSGQNHRVWQINDPVLLDQITASLSPQPLLIADGHHRYETALNHFQQTGKTGSPGAGYVMSILVSMKDPGLMILPTHRILGPLSKGQGKLLAKLIEKEFTIVDYGDPRLLNRERFLEELERRLAENAFGYLSSRQSCLLVPKNKKGDSELSVSLLHDHLLKPLLSLEDDEEKAADILSFSHDFSSTLQEVVEGNSEAAFILPTIPVKKVLDYALQGMTMPQKSTYFYPKMPSGLVLRHLDLSY